jgi:GTP-binding protein
MPATVTIIGRPNVGKSTLFNRLVGKNSALTDARPGVTRDRREGLVTYGSQEFKLVDTAGLEQSPQTQLENGMQSQTVSAVVSAHLVLMVIDGRAGVTPLDQHFNELVRKKNKPALVVVNKSEGRAGEPTWFEAFALGLGEPIAVSAQHGDGISDLIRAVTRLLQLESSLYGVSAPEEESINIAILGRPNTGKSTLFNALLGEDRVLTGPEPGVTRDAIHINWTYRNQTLRLVDTAGLRRKARITDHLEKISTEDSLKALRFCNVALLIIDAVEGLEGQDIHIAQNVAQEGRAMVICLNKWDLVARGSNRETELITKIGSSLPQIKGVRVVACSAKNKTGISELMEQIFEAYQQWNRRLSTSDLNRWLASAMQHHPPPMIRKRATKIRYITQYATRPPRFSLSVNRADALSDTYLRYLVNDLRTSFKLPGVPIRMVTRKSKNPYSRQ